MKESTLLKDRKLNCRDYVNRVELWKMLNILELNHFKKVFFNFLIIGLGSQI
jgi:hypothetical protein